MLTVTVSLEKETERGRNIVHVITVRGQMPVFTAEADSKPKFVICIFFIGTGIAVV